MNTKERILESACRLFSENGYQGTTIAGICQAADANIAAVNYYFGSKTCLYEAVWEYADALANEIYGTTEPEASPEEFLRKHIRKMVLMIFDEGPGGWLPRLVRQDIETGGELIGKMHTRYLLPDIRLLEKAVGTLLGLDSVGLEVRCVTGYIHSICILLNIGEKARQHIFGKNKPRREEIEFLIRSMQDFAEGGIGQVRAALDQGIYKPGSPD